VRIQGQRKRASAPTILTPARAAGLTPARYFDLWPSMGGASEIIDDDFLSTVESAYKANGIVFACILARMLAFSEVRFQFQRVRNGKPGDLFGTPDLGILEKPWKNGTTGELLTRMEQDASLAGNFFATTTGTGTDRRIRRLRPDWVTIISGIVGDPEASPWDIEADVLGYVYRVPGRPGILLAPDAVTHYSPIPDPLAQWRGMSWLSTVFPEVESDIAATKHKGKFFANGTMANMVVTYDKALTERQFADSVKQFKATYSGPDKAYSVIHVGGGADPKMLGADLKSIDFRAIQGAGESRIAAAAGVGSIIARFSEGMQGSSLNAGNYSAAVRQFGDMTIRPLWRIAASSLETLVPPPTDARLWFDATDVAFLRENEKDAAEILNSEAQTIASLIQAGFKPDAAIAAVTSGDLRTLAGQHSGLYSVQLQPLGGSQ
jgi:phage portal protein BeeE